MAEVNSGERVTLGNEVSLWGEITSILNKGGRNPLQRTAVLEALKKFGDMFDRKLAVKNSGNLPALEKKIAALENQRADLTTKNTQLEIQNKLEKQAKEVAEKQAIEAMAAKEKAETQATEAMTAKEKAENRSAADKAVKEAAEKQTIEAIAVKEKAENQSAADKAAKEVAETKMAEATVAKAVAEKQAIEAMAAKEKAENQSAADKVTKEVAEIQVKELNGKLLTEMKRKDSLVELIKKQVDPAADKARSKIIEDYSLSKDCLHEFATTVEDEKEYLTLMGYKIISTGTVKPKWAQHVLGNFKEVSDKLLNTLQSDNTSHQEVREELEKLLKGGL
ncbi:WD-40 repeat protein [Candidatus Rickettsiella viridis]|uniref:WD-40 repeat protein n=1 Tax=Candidatus Rickettsiella viridis TaxID=676208 RepID=A0A2Z5V719_9COXI|nr:WD-40 repeat protein [Candidatus Rickettsiella viridis]